MPTSGFTLDDSCTCIEVLAQPASNATRGKGTKRDFISSQLQKDVYILSNHFLNLARSPRAFFFWSTNELG